MSNSNVTIGVALIEGALKQLTEAEVQQMELVPPDRIHIRARLTPSILGQKVMFYPDAVIQLAVDGSRIRLELVEANIFQVAVPPTLIETEWRKLVQAPEQEVNRQVQEISDKTGLTLRTASLTEDSLVLTF